MQGASGLSHGLEECPDRRLRLGGRVPEGSADSGEILLLWDALGLDLERGDLSFWGRKEAVGEQQWLFQMDGTGVVYLFNALGPEL